MRIDGWEMAYAGYLQNALAQPFAWGQHDCATFAFDLRCTLTGQDAAAIWRGKYTTEAGAIRTCRRLFKGDFAKMGHVLLGDPLPTVLLARRGDIVLGGTPLGWAVVTGAQVVGLSPAGPVTLPLASCALAWRVE